MRTISILGALLLSTAVSAQHAGHQHGAPSAPYSGLQQRQIKALSNEQIADLKAGRGMATALAAELNGYPGPMHVLELADQLRLTDEQRQRMAALMATMRRDAISAGEELIAAEAELDTLFASGRADEALLVTHMRRIAHAQGDLRLVHLRTHMPTRAALTSAQIEAYAKLRGYRPH